jgi:DNA-damage-inducible protein D
LTATFEGYAQQTGDGVEFWLARDLQHLLGYTEWRNFQAVSTKAKIACEVSGHPIDDHFVGVNKMVDLGSGSQREVDDMMLPSRRASGSIGCTTCYSHKLWL